MMREDEEEVYKYLKSWRTIQEIRNKFGRSRAYWNYYLERWIEEQEIEVGVREEMRGRGLKIFRWTEKAKQRWEACQRRATQRGEKAVNVM